MEKSTGTDRAKAPHIRRSHSALAKTTSPTKAAPAPHGSKRLHLHSLRDHHRHHEHRHHARDVIQSAVQLHPPSSFGDIGKQKSKSVDHTPSSTAAGSRRESLTGPDAASAGRPIQSRLVRPEDVEKERLKGKIRDEELRGTLHTLTELSLTTTRRLDDTYYSILEKVGNLHTTISSLQELSTLAKQLHHDFETEAEELETDICGQIEAFGGFTGQQDRIKELELRIEASRGKANALSVRLKDAEQRVQAREKSEEQWQAKTSRRLRILWSTLGAILVLVFTLIIFHYSRTSTSHHAPSVKPGNRSIALSDMSVPPTVKDILRSIRETSTTNSGGSTTSASTISILEDPTFRLLDEL